jgi:hypothetical protein
MESRAAPPPVDPCSTADRPSRPRFRDGTRVRPGWYTPFPSAGAEGPKIPVRIKRQSGTATVSVPRIMAIAAAVAEAPARNPSRKLETPSQRRREGGAEEPPLRAKSPLHSGLLLPSNPSRKPPPIVRSPLRVKRSAAPVADDGAHGGGGGGGRHPEDPLLHGRGGRPRRGRLARPPALSGRPGCPPLPATSVFHSLRPWLRRRSRRRRAGGLRAAARLTPRP